MDYENIINDFVEWKDNFLSDICCEISDGCDCFCKSKDCIIIMAIEAMKNLVKERDAVINMLHGTCNACKHYTAYHNRVKCADCIHETAKQSEEKRVDNWEWRGAKEGAG